MKSWELLKKINEIRIIAFDNIEDLLKHLEKKRKDNPCDN